MSGRMRTKIVEPVLFTISIALFAQILFSPAHSGGPAPLRLETKIPLGNVAGRIDHMAIDLVHRRLFVAELGNGSVSAIDLDAEKVIARIMDLNEPQGLGYVPRMDILYVASAGDGSVHLLKGLDDLKRDGRIDLGNDADNVRVDPSMKHVFVGYGDGSLAAIDIDGRRRVADMKLEAHPEGFQLENNGNRIFVNVPDDGSITVIDRTNGTILAKWSTRRFGKNFPMALDEARREVIAVFRSPPRLVAFSMENGSVVANTATCEDSDDVFVDTKRHRIYVSCGEGFVDVFTEDPGLELIGRIPTVPGARTSLFVPAWDRLFLASRARAGQPAAIWVYQPQP